MKTKYIDKEISILVRLEKSNMISNSGLKKLKEFRLLRDSIKQRDELLEALQEIIRTQNSKSATLHALNIKIKASEKLIQSIEKDK